MDLKRINILLTERNNLFGQVLFLVVVNLIAGTVLSGFFLANGSLYHDNMKYYSTFRDNLHSLNYFGEIQWWHPNVQEGFPAFYLSLLGINSTTPLFVLLGLSVWLLGQMGIIIKSYLYLYIVYFGFLIPMLFSLSLFSLCRQIFSNSRAILFVLLLAAFSPGIVFILSDVYSLEQSIYSLFFASAYLRFVNRPTTTSFWALCMSLLVTAISFNFYSLYWNIVFIPLFVVFVNLFDEEGFFGKTKIVVGSIPPKHWIVAGAMTVVCLLPAFAASTLSDKFIRTHISKKAYEYTDLRAGNPAEFLTVSTPGIGYEWASKGFDAVYFPYAIDANHDGRQHRSYSYMGLLVLTLTFIGLIGGRNPWRRILFFLLVAAAAVIVLSGYSPILGSILALPSPLRANNHFSDGMFRSGGFILLLLSAGLGMEVLLTRNSIWRVAAVVVFSVFSLGSLLLFSASYAISVVQILQKGGTAVILSSLVIFGFSVMMIFSFLVVLCWLASDDSEKSRKLHFFYLLILTFIDLSTCAFWYTRNTMWEASTTFNEPRVDYIGTGNDARSTYTASLLKMTDLKGLEDRGLNFSYIPKWSIYRSASADSVESFVKTRDTASLILHDELKGSEKFGRFFGRTADANSTYSLEDVKQSYNRLSFEVVLSDEGLFFWRDAYFPHWTATVNGKKTDIARAFWGFKAIALPAGSSSVNFSFSPGYIPYLLLAAYGAILSVSCLWISASLRERHDNY